MSTRRYYVRYLSRAPEMEVLDGFLPRTLSSGHGWRKKGNASTSRDQTLYSLQADLTEKPRSLLFELCLLPASEADQTQSASKSLPSHLPAQILRSRRLTIRP